MDLLVWVKGFSHNEPHLTGLFGSVVELVYTPDLKSVAFNGLWVRIPPELPFNFGAGFMASNVVDAYARVILHSGCAIPPKGEFKPRLHSWNECVSQAFFLRIARKHIHKLKSNGLYLNDRA